MKFTLIVIYTLTGGRHDGLTMESKVATFGGEYACQVAKEAKDIVAGFRRLKRGKVRYECRQSSDWWT